jgi:hypothetical protein
MIIILAGIFIAFCLFYYLDQKRKLRKKQLRERRREKFEQLLEALKNSHKSKKDNKY